MINKVVLIKSRTLLVIACLALLLPSVGCCTFFQSIHTDDCRQSDGTLLKGDSRTCCQLFMFGSKCIITEELCAPGLDFCGSQDFPACAPELHRLNPDCIESETSTLGIFGTGLTGATEVTFQDANTNILPRGAVSGTIDKANSDDSHVTVKMTIQPRITGNGYYVQVTTPNGLTNTLWLPVDCGLATANVSGNVAPRKDSNQIPTAPMNLAPRVVATGSIVLTPSADGTVQELAARGGQPSSPVVTATTGPAATIVNVRIPGTPIDRVDQLSVFNFLRYGLATGGAQNFSGSTRLEEFSTSLSVPLSGKTSLTEASFAAAGVVEFDLSGLKSVLQQLNVQGAAVRATVRLTPIRSLNVLDFLTPDSPVHTPTTTQVALLNMIPDQEDLIVNYKDFPRFVSARFTDPDDVATAIRASAQDRVNTVRTDLLGLLAPLTFDVTAVVQRDLRASNPTTGFLVASELNGTGLLFADSSTQIPGISELIAPQLVIELDGFIPPAKPQFISSTNRIPFDLLPQGSTDMMLVTVNNIGGSSGTIALDLASGSNVFGLITPDGRAIDGQTNTAAIAAGERLTFAVTFKPLDGDKFDGQVQVTDTTGGKREVISRIALTGSTFPANFSANLPSITVPIKLQRFPDHAARVGDLNNDGLIDALDVAQLSDMVAGLSIVPSPGTTAFAIADINGDGSVNSFDLVTLADALTKNLTALPRLRPSASDPKGALRKPSTQTQRASEVMRARTRAVVVVGPR